MGWLPLCVIFFRRELASPLTPLRGRGELKPRAEKKAIQAGKVFCRTIPTENYNSTNYCLTTSLIQVAHADRAHKEPVCG